MATGKCLLTLLFLYYFHLNSLRQCHYSPCSLLLPFSGKKRWLSLPSAKSRPIVMYYDDDVSRWCLPCNECRCVVHSRFFSFLSQNDPYVYKLLELMTWLSLVTQEREFQQDSNSISLVCIHCRIFNMLETFHSKRIEYSALHRNENGIFENFISSMLLELLATQSIARHGCNMKNIDPKPSQRILLISNSVNLFFSPLSLSRSAIDNVSRSNYVCSLSIEDVFMCMESWSF